jgi:xanthine dehydrogenase accessory factor
MTNDELLELAHELAARGERYAIVTVVRAVAPTSAYVGAQALVTSDGTLRGWVGGGCAQGIAIDAAKEAIERGDPRLVRISNDEIQEGDDTEQHPMACASDGTIELFIQPHNVRSSVCVLGDTPAADEARFLAERLNLGLADSPDRASVVLIATQGQGDADALEQALESKAQHVLMIASSRKAARLRDAMRMRGIEESRLARLSAPAGPDAGARTPGEIALVAMTGVLAALRGRTVSRTPVRPEAAGTSVKSTPVARVAPPSKAAAADTFLNPVCGAAISTRNPKHVEEYEGVAYYFCCDGCWTSFLKEPAKYAAIYHSSRGRTQG